MEREYKITAEQFESIIHYKRMFEHNFQTLDKLCEEGRDDIVMGFALGQMRKHLSDCYLEMMDLEFEIREQEIAQQEPEIPADEDTKE